MVVTVSEVTVAVVIGALLAVIYSLRILIILERRIAAMELGIQRLERGILKEEFKIERRMSHGGRRRR